MCIGNSQMVHLCSDVGTLPNLRGFLCRLFTNIKGQLAITKIQNVENNLHPNIRAITKIQNVENNLHPNIRMSLKLFFVYILCK